MSDIKNSEKTLIILIMISILVSAYISPFNKYFLENYIYFWLPQISIVALLYYLKVHNYLISVTLIIMILYLVYLSSIIIEPHIAMGWIIYIFTIPGVIIGPLILKSKQNYLSNIELIIYGFLSVISPYLLIWFLLMLF